ncbi:MAG: Ankyrin [Chthonomonadales bacterium]|nr:Ankyrin [Chthonomonadales bacterium]
MKRRSRLRALLTLVLLAGLLFGPLIWGFRREQATRALILAVKADDTQGALEALKAHADPNIREQMNAPVTFNGYLAVLWQRLRGGKPAANSQWTVLELAVQQNNTLVIKALLAAGAANPEETLPRSQVIDAHIKPPLTLLMVAARNENVDIVQALIRQGWEVNTTDSEGNTALFYAKDAATVRALVAQGADLQAKNRTGWSALDCALRAGLPEVANTLLDLGARDAKAITAAVRFGDDTQPLTRMLDQGWKLEAQDEDGETPLMVALDSSYRLNLPAAVLLIERGANVNFQDGGGNTPLIYAADGDRHPPMDALSPIVLKLLLQRGARIDAQNKKGYTALMIAASHLRPALVQLLLEHRAQVNLRTRKGTALAIVRYQPDRDYHDDSQAKVIRLLQAAGAQE